MCFNVKLVIIWLINYNIQGYWNVKELKSWKYLYFLLGWGAEYFKGVQSPLPQHCRSFTVKARCRGILLFNLSLNMSELDLDHFDTTVCNLFNQYIYKTWSICLKNHWVNFIWRNSFYFSTKIVGKMSQHSYWWHLMIFNVITAWGNWLRSKKCLLFSHLWFPAFSRLIIIMEC